MLVASISRKFFSAQNSGEISVLIFSYIKLHGPKQTYEVSSRIFRKNAISFTNLTLPTLSIVQKH